MATKDPRPLQIKIRVSARPGLLVTEDDLIGLLQHVVTTHQIPEGVVIHWLDWKKGEGGDAKEGHITDQLAEQLESFWHAIAHEDSKVEIAKMAATR